MLSGFKFRISFFTGFEIRCWGVVFLVLGLGFIFFCFFFIVSSLFCLLNVCAFVLFLGCVMCLGDGVCVFVCVL